MKRKNSEHCSCGRTVTNLCNWLCNLEPSPVENKQTIRCLSLSENLTESLSVYYVVAILLSDFQKPLRPYCSSKTLCPQTMQAQKLHPHILDCVLCSNVPLRRHVLHRQRLGSSLR